MSFFALALTSLLLSSDPLLSKMEGSWTGVGERIYDTGRRVSITVQTQSTRVRPDLLVSKNHFVEVEVGEESRLEYQRTYWIRPSATEAGVYEMGMGEVDSGRPGSTGRFDGSFESTQIITPSEPPVLMKSKTEFLDADQTLYSDRFWYGDRNFSEATIRYRRATR